MAEMAYSFIPSNEAELAECLADPMWRLCSGQLYKIMVKSPDGADQTIVPFRPNRAQRRLIGRLWHRNIILKARQLGFTTLVCILWLDHALFNANQRCGVIAHNRESAEEIFRDKVKLAYDNLPEALRIRMPLARDSATELLFDHNNSNVRVGTSLRSGTYHRLLVSEYGKVCAEHPKKAKEIMTGSLPTVPLDGITIIESTAEGQGGEFHGMTMRAKELAEKRKDLSQRDYRFHFFPWWQEPGYVIDPIGVVITDKDTEYFDQVEAASSTTLSPEQRAWYVATRDADFSGDPEKMWQEYPSTPMEAFQVSTEGCYYAVQLAAARKAGRVGIVPHLDGVPVNSYWDIGGGDGTGIWLQQRVGLQHRFIKYIENWGEPYSHYVAEMQKLPYVWGKHFLPHDAEHKHQQAETVAAPIEELQKLCPAWKFDVVPRVDSIGHGIQRTRSMFSQAWFDESGCKEGLIHLANYRKEWSKRLGTWSETPRHDIHSEGADAFRQWAQATHPTPRADNDDDYRGRRSRNWKTA